MEHCKGTDGGFSTGLQAAVQDLVPNAAAFPVSNGSDVKMIPEDTDSTQASMNPSLERVQKHQSDRINESDPGDHLDTITPEALVTSKQSAKVPYMTADQQNSHLDGGVEAGVHLKALGVNHRKAELQPQVLSDLMRTTQTNGNLESGADPTQTVHTNLTQAPLEPSYLASLDDHELVVPAEEADVGPIPFFVINNSGRKAASPHLLNDTIDFRIPDACIAADKFVGIRYVQEGGDKSQGSSASPGARLLGAIQDIPAKTVAAAEKTMTSLLSVLPSPRKTAHEAAPDPALPSSCGGNEHESGTSTESHGAASEEAASSSAPSERRNSGRHSSTNSPELHVWEILYKDHSKHTQDRPGGTLQQIQFETTKAGFRFIQRIIDIWSLEATDSSAMTGAAKAALKAQDCLQQGDPDYPFSKPDPPESPSTFPRSLFGKARNAPDPLHRTPSEDLRLSNFPVERTESGVSAADSVDSVSSARSTASGGNVSIALVASGSKNGYGGGLHHVVIPEAEAVAGPPPPEKPGVPMVEGRFLPNMLPHSHVLQQPHIRALAAALPLRFRLSPWVLLYSTWRDGISLQTMYRKVAKKGPGITIILDRNHNVFGCYTSENWKVHPRYYGSGESFVFQLYPEMRIYRWTRDNNYFMFGTPDSIHIGGGSHFALSVSGDLLSGSTGSCETFGNGPLVKPEEYQITHVELWGFQ